MQAKFDAATGAITAGAGNVTLDADGATLALGSTLAPISTKVKWTSAGGDAAVYGYYTGLGGSTEYAVAALEAVKTKTATIAAKARGADSSITLSADSITLDNLNVGTATGAGTGDVAFSGDLQSYKNSTLYTGYAFVPLTTPLTSTSWDGDAYSTTAKTLIDLSAVFGAPAGVKAILVYTGVRDSGSSASDCRLVLSPNDTDGIGLQTGAAGQTNDMWSRDVLIVPCDANGDIYYQIVATGASTMDVYIQIWGYYL